MVGQIVRKVLIIVTVFTDHRKYYNVIVIFVFTIVIHDYSNNRNRRSNSSCFPRLFAPRLFAAISLLWFGQCLSRRARSNTRVFMVVACLLACLLACLFASNLIVSIFACCPLLGILSVMIVCNCLEDVELCYAGYCSRNGIQMDGACSTRHFQGLGCAVRSRLTMSSLIALLPAPWTRSLILWSRWRFFWAFGSRFCFQILLT